MNSNIRTSAQLAINRLKSLPALPEASVKILEAINDPDISIEKLSEVLSLSPSLVARLLGLANSAYFGQIRPITELRTAIIQVLGLQLVKSLAVGIVLNVQIDTSECKNFDTRSFWMHSLLTAMGAQKLFSASRIRNADASTIYTSGLLLHIGLLAIVYLFPKDMDEVLATKQKDYLELSQAISLHLGLNHYQLGYMLLNKWQLPDVYQAVLRHFEDVELKGDQAKQILVLRASQQICWLLLDETACEKDEAFLQRIADSTALSFDAIAEAFNELFEKRENILKLADAIGNI
ncbi:HDOD domain-containing protein [Methylomonas sp. MgM2]